MKAAKRTEVERFLTEQGYAIKRDSGNHTFWAKPGNRSVPVPRHKVISPKVLKDIETAVGFVPREWK